MRQILTVTALALGLAACDSSGPTAPRIEDTTFAPQLGIDLAAMTRTASGLYIQTLEQGEGAAVGANSEVSIYYTGWLADGTEFDSAVPPEQPLTIFLSQLIRGMGEGLRGMQVGGRRRLVIPPSLGYGRDGSPPVIPGNAILVFDIELVAVN
jgi:FKBP-type peptidyl-prolyl cis-trans isomerase FkpA